MLFDVRLIHRDGWSVVSVVGDIDLASFPVLRQELEHVDGDRVALDLSSVDFLDPVGLGVVIAGALRVNRRDGRYVVVCPPGSPRHLLAETRIDTIIDVVDALPVD